MALIKGTNSYATVEEANAYFSDRIDVAAYDSAGDDMKAKALITATSLLDTYTFVGQAISSSQSLAFPRSGSYFDPKLNRTVFFTDQIPDRIQKATFELAYHLLNNDGLLDSMGDVKNLKVGPIEIESVQMAPKVNSFVLNLIQPLRLNSGSQSWWRAN